MKIWLQVKLAVLIQIRVWKILLKAAIIKSDYKGINNTNLISEDKWFIKIFKYIKRNFLNKSEKFETKNHNSEWKSINKSYSYSR